MWPTPLHRFSPLAMASDRPQRQASGSAFKIVE